jgi:hypothetical protein
LPKWIEAESGDEIGARLDAVTTSAHAAHQAGAHVDAGWDADAIASLYSTATSDNPVHPNLALDRLRRRLGKQGLATKNRESQRQYSEVPSLKSTTQ